MHASAVEGSIMGVSRMENSFVVISTQKRSRGHGIPPHSPAAAAQHTEPSQSTRAIEGSYIMLPPPAASIYKTSSCEANNSGFYHGVTVLKRAFDIATSQTQV
jgi:beclin